MRILVTGGAGFIGSNYVRTLLDGGYPGYEEAEVTVLDWLTYAGNTGNLPMEHPRLHFVKGDVADVEMMQEIVPGHHEVVHFAAESHVDRSLTDPSSFVHTNVLGTQVLLDACMRSGVRKVVHVSTDEVYGSLSEGAWTEEWPLAPNSPYAASKASSDLIARAYHRSYGLDVRITRCSNNYGPYQYVEKLIPCFITNLVDGLTVPLYGEGHNVREWIHVDDHCRAVQLVLTDGRPGEIYNIGGDAQMSNREMTARLLGLCGVGWDRVRHVADRKGHDLRYALDDTKIRTELGFRPSVPIEDGLASVVRWYIDNPTWWRPLKDQQRQKESTG